MSTGLITQIEKYNKVVDAWAKCTDEGVADEMMDHISSVRGRQEDRHGSADQLDLHDGPLRCARLAGTDEAARRHARPDGQAFGRDHRNADHLQLQGRVCRCSSTSTRPTARARALPTPRSRRPTPGYLTRRLVDVAQDSIILEDDCGTEDAIRVGAVIDAW